jgi:lipoyl(octanoyl) transferase
MEKLASPVQIRYLGLAPYQATYQAMQHFTENRQADTVDELWILQHAAVYTLGQAGKWEHLLNPGPIPVYQVDRGGQITYHGPGQLITYVLLDLKRRHWGVKQLVFALEQAVINYLAHYDIQGKRRDQAPGVYVNEHKLAALGLRVRRGCSYHGLSLNVAMDLTPFERINPCGYAGLTITQLRDLGINANLTSVSQQFLPYLLNTLQLYSINNFISND